MNSDPSGLILHWLSDMHLSMMAGINNSLNNYILNQQINLLNYNASTMVSLSDSEMRNVSGGVDPKHSPGTFLTPEQYMNLCSKIKCVR